jgi:hypothetical protein
MFLQEQLLQIVGHTPVKNIQRDRNVISCDVFSNDSRGRQYGSREFLLIDTENWEYSGLQK